MLTVQDKDLGKIPYGEFIKISPTRVPRLIGKRGSMIQTIEQDYTDKSNNRTKWHSSCYRKRHRRPKFGS